jgi:hypothetical protein
MEVNIKQGFPKKFPGIKMENPVYQYCNIVFQKILLCREKIHFPNHFKNFFQNTSYIGSQIAFKAQFAI